MTHVITNKSYLEFTSFDSFLSEHEKTNKGIIDKEKIPKIYLSKDECFNASSLHKYDSIVKNFEILRSEQREARIQNNLEYNANLRKNKINHDEKSIIYSELPKMTKSFRRIDVRGDLLDAMIEGKCFLIPIIYSNGYIFNSDEIFLASSGKIYIITTNHSFNKEDNKIYVNEFDFDNLKSDIVFKH